MDEISQTEKGEYGITDRKGNSLGLRFKLVLLVSIVSLVAISVGIFLLDSLYRQQMIENAQLSAITLGATIEVSLHHAMLANDWAMVNDILNSLVQEPTVDNVRIFNHQGRIIVSTISEEIGVHIDPENQMCLSCHSMSEQRDAIKFYTEFIEETQIIQEIKIIENQPECTVCHSPENNVLGFYTFEIPLGTLIEKHTERIWSAIFIGLLAIIILIGLLIPGINLLVIKPVHEISRGVEKINTHNLDYQVPVMSQDELGELAESFNLMSKHLNSTYQKMEQREQELAILNDVAFAATQLLDLQECIHLSLQTVVSRLGMEAGIIYLFDELSGDYTYWASVGVAEGHLENVSLESNNQSSNNEISDQNKYFTSVCCLTEYSYLTSIFDNEQERLVVKVPIIAKGELIGIMMLITNPSQIVSERIKKVLITVGREIGIAIDNAMLLTNARKREHEATALHELGIKISKSLELDALLKSVARAARVLLQTDIGIVGLLDDRKQEIVIEATSGDLNKTFVGMRVPFSGETILNAIKAGEPIMADTIDPNQSILHDDDLFSDEHIASYLAVPLIRGEKVLGLIEVMTRERRRFLQRDAHLLMRLAHHVTVSIENAQLYRKLHLLATLEERDRIAGELHDHLAQTLGYLNVKASMTQDLISKDRIDLAEGSLEELKKVARIAYTDVREAIFNLRTDIQSPVDLLPMLQEYFDEYTIHYGVKIHLETGGHNLVGFSPMVATQLLRIIQEALTNIRKHAKVNNARVRFHELGDQAIISIEDEGLGFDDEKIGNNDGQQFGLKIMRERAESVGGCLEIKSRPGVGTSIIIWVPFTNN